MPPRALAANVVGMIRRGSVAHAAGAAKADTLEYSSVEAGLAGACLRRAWCTKGDSSKRYSSRRQLTTRWCHNCGGVIVHASLTDEHRGLPVDCSFNVDTFLGNDLPPTACGQPSFANTHCRSVNGQEFMKQQQRDVLAVQCSASFVYPSRDERKNLMSTTSGWLMR